MKRLMLWNHRTLPFVTMLITTIVLVSSSMLAQADDTPTKEVTVRELTLQMPESWMKKENTSRFRLAEFDIPVPGTDLENADLILFHFQGAAGKTDANIMRWLSQFDPAGRTSTVKEGKTTDGSYILVDVQGDYKNPVGPPVLGKFEKMENARVISVILNTGDDVYYLKLVGKQDTIKEIVDDFRKSFGGDAETEKDYEFEI
ncbi:hypothetical protein Pla110_37390 [Polystyrenella longa]|uniref:DUF4252 domain-containing protein n=1 Tax=Polystyrenella longa TaxID=2528007 RepID=A0A518CRY3_9PLAN|nr:hypothetical protein [Polystyrenella longa]QDU81987.1 hypothetical protein Pla110_37390 [Polystyrenella longa]